LRAIYDYDVPPDRLYLQADPVGREDQSYFAYAGLAPTYLFDTQGLRVEVCSRPVEFWAAPEWIPHLWLKTDSVEAGLGPVGGPWGQTPLKKTGG
jgi:hypothetical protein